MGRQGPGFGDARSFTQDIQSASVDWWAHLPHKAALRCRRSRESECDQTSVMDAEGIPWVPHMVTFAETRVGCACSFPVQADTTPHVSSADMKVGCEASGHY
jgi:hypothetical protein